MLFVTQTLNDLNLQRALRQQLRSVTAAEYPIEVVILNTINVQFCSDKTTR